MITKIRRCSALKQSLLIFGVIVLVYKFIYHNKIWHIREIGSIKLLDVKLSGGVNELVKRKNLTALQNLCRDRITWLDTPAGRSSLPSKGFKFQNYARWKRTSPMNIDFVFNNLNVCKDGDGIILIYVFSGALNFEAREQIRSTWGSVKSYRGFVIKTVFLLGRRSDLPQSRIFQESKEHEDIIQADFEDSYDNVTIKSYIGLKWVVNFCPNAKWCIKADDDVFINIYNFIDRLLAAKPPPVPQLLCKRYLSSGVARLNKFKWFMTKEEYPETTYPPYCNGPYYIYPTSLALSLYACYTQMNFFRIEDVFTTGIVAHILNISGNNFYGTDPLTNKHLTEPLEKINFFHGSNIKSFQKYNSTFLANGRIMFKYLWQKVNDSRLK